MSHVRKLNKGRATYQHPPRPAERERVRSVGEDLVGVLREDLWSLSVSADMVGRRVEGSDIGDAFGAEAAMSGDGCSNSGDDA